MMDEFTSVLTPRVFTPQYDEYSQNILANFINLPIFFPFVCLDFFPTLIMMH